MTMPVEINQWRAAIGCSRASIQKLLPISKIAMSLSFLFQLFRLCWFCCCFIAVSILALPLALVILFVAVHTLAIHLCILPLFARMHHFAKVVIYMIYELLKRIPLGIICLVRYKYLAVKHHLLLYTYLCIWCIMCNTLHMQWLACRTIMLSGDVETNPGPETKDFSTWNLNSIAA